MLQALEWLERRTQAMMRKRMAKMEKQLWSERKLQELQCPLWERKIIITLSPRRKEIAMNGMKMRSQRKVEEPQVLAMGKERRRRC
jgi:hypothetical protein